MKKIVYGAFAATALLGLSACGASSAASEKDSDFPAEIVLGAVPAENSTDLAEGYDPIVKLLEEETGAKVEFSQASDYAGVVEGMIAGNVDLAVFGPFAYVIATQNEADITPLGAVKPTKDEPSGYKSYAITQGDNAGIDELKDFAGKKVCFVDPGSTSGFLYPSAGLIEEGIIKSAREEDLSAGVKPIYAGSHDAAALAVKNGECDAGFAMESMIDKTLPAKGDLKDGDLKKVWTSETIAGNVMAGSNELGDAALEKLRKIIKEKANSDYLKKKGFCDGDCTLTDEDAWGFEGTEDAAYDGVREVCATTKSDKCEN
ncbi:phosphate/phosphite/phosphonate ABC transporter substrate-binding protein [Saxibacter everestensis]|uniref:Phosphate/phosphite/phosphonate ABC transporter substrate-binding protein n=1 Tax=Saxibacter everestensis TaxID=2909229 RepID=A0ABY8QZY6_9MICO|nr:phosphate/phosphite/phosphonate ABC transporter substrate-binding protein [Brevibacteriaceae bacterium ZFBP1038]